MPTGLADGRGLRDVPFFYLLNSREISEKFAPENGSPVPALASREKPLCAEKLD